MGQCNYCILQDIKRRAKKDKKKVTIRSDAFHTWEGGKVVLVHEEGEAANRDKHVAAWLASVPNHCVC